MFELSEGEEKELARRFSICLSNQDQGLGWVNDAAKEVNKPRKYMQSLEKGSKTLFVGAGSGREVLLASEMGLDAYGITLGPSNLELGRSLGLSKERLLEGHNEVLPFSSETFDAVAGFQILEHSVSPLLFLLECNRVLKDQGCIFLEWPPSHPTSSYDPKHVICPTPGQARALLLKSGFSNIELLYADLKKVPEAEYWQGLPDRGYVVAQASRAPNVDLNYVNTFRGL